MQYENDKLIDAAKEYIQLMKDSGLGYFRIKNDKFEIELGDKHPHFMPPMPPMMPQPGQQSAQDSPAPQEKDKPGNIVTSPIVGTFYAAPSPEKPPYVQVGKQVHKGDVLFIIESMKLMNEVTSDYDGVVAEIMADDGETVEFGEPIMRIE
ncbi:MAG: acetyl-CoA carboxylase biotin carboxyl carrier protein [Ruminiclostridium sp.]|nr:acetyl-CoA carboxylase biotin carboxyl carrier protein [Ruminiclostridium sp.]